MFLYNVEMTGFAGFTERGILFGLAAMEQANRRSEKLYDLAPRG
jgi:hypothetical protein